MTTYTLLCIISLSVASCSGLSCIPCAERSPCPDPSTLECPWGTVKDICHCCEQCGKGAGEACGGPWDLRGKCGRCRVCVRENKEAEGVCVPLKEC